MTAPLNQTAGGPFRPPNKAARRKYGIEQMGQAYAEGGAQSDYDDPAETANAAKEYDLLQRANRRKRATKFPEVK